MNAERRPQEGGARAGEAENSVPQTADKHPEHECCATDLEFLDAVTHAHIVGYDIGYAHGRNDRLEDERDAALHDYACRMIGLRPHPGPPMWAIAR